MTTVDSVKTIVQPIGADTVARRRQAEKLAGASEWRLIWWRFRRHRIAYFSGFVVLAIYLVAIFADFVAPTAPDTSKPQYTYAQPQRLHLFRTTYAGWSFSPHVLGYAVKVDPAAMRRV